MPRQNLTAEFKTFVKGIVTEVSPLTFPNNASIDETNFVLNRDGSRDRRLGLDLEENFSYYTVSLTNASETPVSSYRWIDGKGLGAGDIVVVQVGNSIQFYDASEGSLSPNLIGAISLLLDSEGSVQTVKRASFTRTGKNLILAFGGNEIYKVSYDSGTISTEPFRLKIRDFFGVGDLDTDGTDMTEGLGLLRRPSVQTDAHVYNLRNQSWSQKYISIATGSNTDPLASWKSIYSEWPANSDIITREIYPDTSATNKTVDRFWETNLHDTDYGTGEPAKGSFIIDFVNRGASRQEEVTKLETEKGLSYPVTSLPSETEDSTASAVASYSGRVFYGGFPGSSNTENSKTPDTASFVLFSQLIRSGSEFGKCYQEGDPTSRDNPDLVATDGGYIQLEDAYNIHTMLTNSSGLIVIAQNGVWLVAGGSGYSFSADNFVVKRLSDKGAISPDSVVKVDETILYWGEEGIFQLAPNTYGDLVSTNLSKNTIQTLYDNIPFEYKEACKGVYDPYESKVRWVYGDFFQTTGEVTELILDTSLGAFYKSTFENYGNHSVILPVLAPPYDIDEFNEDVTAEGVVVTADGVDVFVTTPVRSTGIRGIRYLVAESLGGYSYGVSFATYSNQNFLDWYSVDSTGTDASAYLLTGYFSGDDVMRQKQVMKLITYLRRSETGFETDSEGDWVPVNTSSCLVSAQWGWTDDAVAGKWANPVQAYRLKRPYFPEDLSDGFDNGEPVVVTSNKLRGRGRVVSLRIDTEEGKDLQMLGWAMVVNINGAA